MQYQVKSSKYLTTIITHFDKYPLITQKWSDYQLFKQALNLFNNKEHLTDEGFKKILNIRASMNLGIPEELKMTFPNINPVLRPLPIVTEVNDLNWLAGFASGEGCFFCFYF
uniref:Homing endonuclease LAGLIDADG domain-containing protein n=1 Tax=Dactylella tenuis TaxID=383872 RepID=A0A4Y5MUZ9_9PEZI|nr:hypothetical protein [Dactylella tenuis]QCW06863.1 hypothetical protein [Dactylella tenuis]